MTNDKLLDIKIGQMILAGFPSKTYDETVNEIIENYKIGNIILFANNIGTKREVAKLTYDLQKNLIKSTGIPGFIAIDQEGGMVTRIHDGITVFPGNMAFAAADADKSTLKEGEIEGEELKALGINLNLAPVLDVNSNYKNPVIGVRSYGDNPAAVSKLGIDLICGLKKSGVIATAKHFPGHGDTDLDSHINLPVVTHNIEHMEKIDLYPFKEAIKNGIDAIMTAHVLFPAIEDKKIPATLSYKILTGLLRNKLGFEGLIITDCMEMDAIATFYGSDKAAVMAVKAGADLICISHSIDVQVKCFNAIKSAVLNGDISEKRIDVSYKRITEMKKKYCLCSNNQDFNMIDKITSSPDNRKFAQYISDKSITVVKDENNLLPVSGKVISISTVPAALTGIDNEYENINSFAGMMEKKFGGESFIIPLNPDMDLISRIQSSCRGADRVVIGLYNSSKYKNQKILVDKVYEVNKKIIAVSLRNPYDYLDFKYVPAFINSYEYTHLSVNSTIKVLAGEITAKGKSPVKI